MLGKNYKNTNTNKNTKMRELPRSAVFQKDKLATILLLRDTVADIAREICSRR